MANRKKKHKSLKQHKTWSMVIGRFQCLPPHSGHTGIIDQLLKEGKNVLIMIRKEDGTDKNPYTQQERCDAFFKLYPHETKSGRIIIASIPNVDEVVYGRTPGWKIREVVLPENIQKISATEIRKKEKEIDG